MAANFLPMGKGMFDYISVDGRARMHCLVRALPLLKPEGGVLLLDNSERELYQKAFDMVPSWWLKARRRVDQRCNLLLCLLRDADIHV